MSSATEEKLLSEGRITDEGIAALRELIGHELRQSFRFNTEVSFDNVRHLCWGIGDDNPLWLDPGHAEASPYGTGVAPPGFLWTLHPTWVQMGLPGVHGFHSGSTLSFLRPFL